MLLYYIRHGDPTYHPDALTPLGICQAEALSRRLTLHGLDEIYASTSERARMTALPTAELLKKEITFLDWCHENHAWDEFAVPDEEAGGKRWVFQHSTLAPMLNDPEVRALGEAWHTHSVFAPYDFARGMDRVARETDAFLAQLGYTHDRAHARYICTAPHARRIALFAHQGFGNMFLSTLLDIPYPLFTTRFDMGHTGVTVIRFAETGERCVPQVLTYSNDSHIFAQDLPTLYKNEIFI